MKKLVASATVLMCGTMMLAPGVGSAMTQEELQAQIDALLAQLSDLQDQLDDGEETTPPAGGTIAGCEITSFDRNLKVGMTGSDVKCMQIVLNSDSDTVLGESGAGSPGNETSYFGPITKAGVVKFQEKYTEEVLSPYGLTTGTGFVGSTTRAQLNVILAAGGGETEEKSPSEIDNAVECITAGYYWGPDGCYNGVEEGEEEEEEEEDLASEIDNSADCIAAGYYWGPDGCYSGTEVAEGLTVALASDTPASATIVAGQAVADLAHFTFTGDSTITSLKLKRIGVSADATLNNVYLYDGNTRITDSATASNGVLTFVNTSGLFTVSGSRVISVKSDILTGTAGETVGVGIVAATDITSDASAINGTFPMNGNMMSIAVANLATVVVGTVSPSAVTTVNAGTMNYTVFSAPLSVGTRSINLSHVAFKLIGSVPTDALENINIYVNGIAYGDSVSVDVNGNLVFDLTTPAVVQSGSATLEVRADIVKGSSRNFSFSLQNAADLVVVDSNYNVNVAATGIPATTASVTINPGSVAATLDSTFNATTVTGGISNATLARYSLKAYGENVKISYLDVTPSRNLDNVTLFANDVQIANSQNYTGTKLHFSLGSSLVIPAGTTVAVEVRSDTKAASVNITTGTVVVTLNGYANNAQGVNSLSLSTVPSSDIAGPTLTVGTGGLVLAQNSGFLSQNIVANTLNQKIGSFVIQAGNSEAIRLSNLSVALGGTLSTTSLSNLYVKYGTTQSTPVNPQSTNNFPVNTTINPNSSITADVYADIGTMGTVVNTNTTPQTFANVDTTAATASVAASRAITVTGTTGWDTNDTATITINGYPSVYTCVGDDESPTTVAAGIVVAININNNVNGIVLASNVAGVVTVTAKTVGTAGNAITLTTAISSSGDGTLSPLGASSMAGGSNGNIQVDTSTPANVETGDVFTAVINSTTFNFTATAATAANVADGLVALINASSAVNSIVTADNNADTLRVTADVAGTAGAFTMTSSAANGYHSATGSTIITTLAMSATGVTSNSTVASAPASLAGQTMTIATGSLAVPTKTSDSPVAQFVIGGSTDMQLVKYNFVASVGAAVIDELRFTMTGTSVDATQAPISTITVNGVTVPVIANVATLTEVNFTVPVGYAGIDLPVTVAYNSIGYGGNTSNKTATATLDYLKYHVGNTTTVNSTLTVAASTMTVVASKPVLSIGPTTTRTGLSNSLIKLADVTVTADTAGSIKLQQLPITVNSTGVVSIGSQTVVVKDGSTNIPLTSGTLAVVAANSGSVSIILATPFNVAANTSKVFSIYATASDVAGDVGSTSLSTKLGVSSSFLWTDVEGDVAGITGAQIYNYPDNNSVISN